MNRLSLCFIRLAPRGLSRKPSAAETKYAPMLSSVEINPLYMPESTNSTNIHMDTASMTFNAFPPFISACPAKSPAPFTALCYLVTLTYSLPSLLSIMWLSESFFAPSISMGSSSVESSFPAAE